MGLRKVPGIVAAAASLLLAGCGDGDGGAANEAPAAAAPDRAGNSAAAAAPTAGPAAAGAGRWALDSSGEGVALALRGDSGGDRIRLFCPAGAGRLVVNVPGFRPIGSEERLSFGGGGQVEALVADPRGDSRRGGVTGAGAVPDSLAAMLEAPVSASYGAQTAGPHPPPPPNLARAFAAACAEPAAASTPAPAPAPGGARAGACMTQDGAPLDVGPLRALGTEPFWAARIEGRCVTYSHPEDQQGTRVWTRYAPAPGGGGRWTGALGGQPFELRLRPQPGCSDGMSDTRYPMAAELLVGGERRRGCAAPR